MKASGKISVALIAGLLLLPAGFRAGAQMKASGIRVVAGQACQDKDSIRVSVELEVTGVSVARREQLLLFPVIRAEGNERRMPLVVVNGRTQRAVARRAEKLSGRKTPLVASYTAKRHGFFEGKIDYSGAVAAENWMRDAHVALVEERTDCRGKLRCTATIIFADSIVLQEKPRRPVYELPVRMPIPPREEIKDRSASGEAQIIYTVGNAEIKPGLGNNRQELDNIRHSIEDVRQIHGAKINSVLISSYASPEGSWRNNLSLSERRAASLANWIRHNYDMAGIAFSSQGLGEDWNGLVYLIENDPVLARTEKEALLAVITFTTDSDMRKRYLRQHNGGRTYRYLLSNMYPRLRRSVYRIDFSVPEYSVETIKEIFKTHPDMLSLYEFYLLANQYEPGSPEFRKIIEKAAEIYPDDKLNKIAMAMFSYFSGNVKAGLEYLHGLEDDPDAWLYFSTIYAKDGDLDNADLYAKRALAAGNPDAAEDLRLIERYRTDDELYKAKLAEWEKYNIKK